MSLKDIFQPSTRAFYREARQVRGSSFFNLLHGYVYARWTYFYIGIGSGRHPLAKRLAPLLDWIGNRIVANAARQVETTAVKWEDTYHGKVVPLEAAKQLVSVKEDITLGDLEHVIPYSLARDIVLKNPDHIMVLDCPCRVASEHPCLPLDVCLIVGEPFASFVSEHHPQRSRQISSLEAQEILQEEDRRGHVHHAFFKDAMLGRFYAICNCCACCCGAMRAQRSGTRMLASSGYVAQVDSELCVQCEKCVENCQFSAIQMEETAVVDQETCMGCGICVGQCDTGAIKLERMESKGEPLEIETMIAAFNLVDRAPSGEAPVERAR
jgi:NAD-dependent dihydropyrimidine dehydrogenase PreA subunit